jgi:hypothetical protein
VRVGIAREKVGRVGSRRESLSLFTNDLHISSGNDSGDEATALPQTPGVVRRPVTRRGNLLVSSNASTLRHDGDGEGDSILTTTTSPNQDNSVA